jgi:uncharacterized protein YecT (DUF1311 family)
MMLMILALSVATPLNCEEAVTQPDLNACAARAYQQADKALNRQYVATTLALRREDAAGQRLSRLRQAQRAWITFRDAHCDSAFLADIGASLDYTLAIECRTHLTEERTRQLAELAREH